MNKHASSLRLVRLQANKTISAAGHKIQRLPHSRFCCSRPMLMGHTRHLHKHSHTICFHLLKLLCCVMRTLNLLVCQGLIQVLLPTAARTDLLEPEN